MKLRRSQASMIAAAAALALLASCGGGSGGGTSKDNSLTFVSYGSGFQKNQIKAYQKPFTKKHGTKFTNVSPVDLAKLKAMVESDNVGWDVVDVGAGTAVQYCGKYIQPLDYSVIDKSSYPEGTATKCGVPAYFWSVIFMYDAKKFGDDPPDSVADFFNKKKYPGKRIVPPELDAGFLGYALLADGVPADKLYPLDVDRALKKWDSIKDVTIVPESYGQIQQAMVGRQVTMALASTARAYLALKEGAPFEPVWDKTFVSYDDLVIPKGAPNADLAMKFVKFTGQPDVSKHFAELQGVLPVNPKIKPDYNKIQEKVNVFSDAHQDSIFYYNPQWWGKHHDSVISKIRKWLVG